MWLALDIFNNQNVYYPNAWYDIDEHITTRRRHFVEWFSWQKYNYEDSMRLVNTEYIRQKKICTLPIEIIIRTAGIPNANE